MRPLFILTVIIILFGCKAAIQEYQKSSPLKSIEHIGPRTEEKPYELPKERTPLPQRETIELTEEDLFAKKDWNIRSVSVFNITLGDSLAQVLYALGDPDEILPHPTLDIVNLGYGSSLGLDEIGLVFFVVNNTVQRITIKKDFNPYLKGQTVIDYTKEDIYNTFGIPAEQKDLPTFRVFRYKNGLEIIHSGRKMKGFVLAYPISVEQGTGG